jgi:hypothetical protein
MRSPLVLALVVAIAAGCSTLSGAGASGDSANARCGPLRSAVATVRYHLELLIQLDDPVAYEEIRDVDAPFKVDPEHFRQAVEVVAVLSGVEGEANRLRRLAELLEQNLGIEDPFAEGSQSGEQLQRLADETFGQAQVVLDDALVAAGCPIA